MAAALTGCAVAMLALQVVLLPAARRAALEEVPPAVGELAQHVNVDDSRAFLNEIREKGLAGETLHPLGDLNPFTHLPEEDDNPESVLRRAKTRAIVRVADETGQQDMAEAQQAARDDMGTDAGCTHEKEDQTDYAGEIAQTVSGGDCMDWQEAIDNGFYNITVEPLSEGLSEPQVDTDENPVVDPSLTGNYCRNPYKQRIAAWCILASATPGATGEGSNWEYCDVGSRCGVNVPVLKPAVVTALEAAHAQQQQQQQLKVHAGAGSSTQLATRLPPADRENPSGASLKSEGAADTTRQLRASSTSKQGGVALTVGGRTALRPQVSAAQLRVRGEGAGVERSRRGPVLAAPLVHAQMRGRAAANGARTRGWGGSRQSAMTRRITRAIGRKTAKMQTGHGLRRSHKQQLALMPSVQSGAQRRAGRPDIDGRGHMSTADARAAIGEGWFVLDPHRQNVQDAGVRGGTRTHEYNHARTL